LNGLGMDSIAVWEHQLLSAATEKLKAIDELRIIGNAKHKASVISFVLNGIHPHDVGSILDMEGVVVRAGHHCAQPVMQRFSVPATTRASFAFYNNEEDIDALVSGIIKAKEIFS